MRVEGISALVDNILLLGWSTMLLGGTVPAEQRTRALETTERNARAQARLIEDMLDLSRIEQGKL